MIRIVRNLATVPRPLYVTSPIFYVNASPHLGHLYTMLLCDVRNRWHKLSGSSSFFTTGTDEHGLKIQNVAENRNMPPKQLVDEVSQNFKFLANKLNIRYDRFIRTTDSDHIKAVNSLWNIMIQKDLIYKGEHSGWYSISDETFYPETQIEEVEDGKFISEETRNEVKYHSEINYFFRLSQFQDQLIEFLEADPEFIIPSTRYSELLAELKSEKLEDLSVSRPSSRLTWGIEVPDDASQRMYVWFDALTNYITSVGFPDSFHQSNGKWIASDSNPWPAIHVIGKDITRFHCIYWPIFLMAAQIDLPRKVVVHSHWLSEGFKMSKSLGNVVDPIATCEHYGEDALRFFLMEYSNINSDCNYSDRYFNFTRDNLIGKYANIMTRCGGKAFDIHQSVKDYNEGKFDDIEQVISMHAVNDAQKVLEVRKELIDKLNTLYEKMDGHVQNFDNMKAIQEWWGVLELTNQFLQFSEPWVYTKLIKAGGDESLKRLQNYYILLACESVRICSIVISPVIPTLAGKVLDRLNVKEEDRNVAHLKPFEDISYGEGANSKNHKLPIERLEMKV